MTYLELMKAEQVLEAKIKSIGAEKSGLYGRRYRLAKWLFVKAVEEGKDVQVFYYSRNRTYQRCKVLDAKYSPELGIVYATVQLKSKKKLLTSNSRFAGFNLMGSDVTVNGIVFPDYCRSQQEGEQDEANPNTQTA